MLDCSPSLHDWMYTADKNYQPPNNVMRRRNSLVLNGTIDPFTMGEHYIVFSCQHRDVSYISMLRTPFNRVDMQRIEHCTGL